MGGTCTDVIIQASLPTIGPFLVLFDIQLRHTPRMPRRVQAYAGLAEEKYDRPVFAVVLLLLNPGPQTVISDRYEETFLGMHARRDFLVIKAWELDVSLVFEEGLLVLLPFVPLMRGGDNEVAIRRALQLLRDHPQLLDLEPLLAFFASYVLPIKRIERQMGQSGIWQSFENHPGISKSMRKGISRGSL
ncbi:MAG: transposase [Chloroflexaceae bacterium]|nr:transposase [Chloroflexaceae bacterium]